MKGEAVVKEEEVWEEKKGDDREKEEGEEVKGVEGEEK